MSVDLGKKTLNDILAYPGTTVLAWVERALRRQRPPEIFWHGLADGASSKASAFVKRGKKLIPIYAMSVDERRDWATVALRIYAHLAQKTSHRDSFEHSAMLTRCRVIELLGPAPGDPICDPRHIIAWFFERLTMTPAEARTRTHMSRRPVDRKLLDEIAAVRVRLSVVKLVVRDDPSLVDSRLKEWLDIADELAS